MSKAVKVGILVSIGVVLFALGLFLIGSSKQLFSHHYAVYVEFNDVDTIQGGATVRVSGMNAGTVDTVALPATPSGKFRLKLTVDDKFKNIVREDSVATIETQGMVGNEFVQIKKGTDNSPECQPGCTIQSHEAPSVSQLMQQGNEIADQIKSTIKDLHGRADVVMGNISDLTGHADRTIQRVGPDIQTMAASGVRISGNIDHIVAGVRSGQGAAGKMLVDQQTAQDVTRIVQNAKEMTANADEVSAKAQAMIGDIQEHDLPKADQTLTNVQDMTGQLDSAVGTFLAKGTNQKPTAVVLRETVQHADQASGNLADDTEAIKHNFLFRGFFKRRGFYNLANITPSKYEASEFIKKPAARVWIPAAGVFMIGPDGAQQLTPQADTAIDQALSGIVPYLPNNPIMVEGYSEAGSPEQRYAASEQRAEDVRQYLESKLHVKSKWVGIIGFEDHPPKRSGRQTWDGVSVVVIQSR
jgi:phospholipid/cholesterol/gamma-HCH transport system substrate-binding protein